MRRIKPLKTKSKNEINSNNQHSIEIIAVDEMMGKRLDTITHQITDIPQTLVLKKLFG